MPSCRGTRAAARRAAKQSFSARKGRGTIRQHSATTSGGRSMDSAGTAPTEISQGPLLSQPQRIINTFFEPAKTFTDLNRGTAWWMAFLLSVIISYGFVAAVATKVTFEQANENEMKLSPKQMEKMDQMPPADRARAIGIGVTITKVISYAY